eukprot:g28802.t1
MDTWHVGKQMEFCVREDQEDQQQNAPDRDAVEKSLIHVGTQADDKHRNPPTLEVRKFLEAMKQESEKCQLSEAELRGFVAEAEIDAGGDVAYVDHIKTWVPILFELRSASVLCGGWTGLGTRVAQFRGGWSRPVGDFPVNIVCSIRVISWNWSTIWRWVRTQLVGQPTLAELLQTAERSSSWTATKCLAVLGEVTSRAIQENQVADLLQSPIFSSLLDRVQHRLYGFSASEAYLLLLCISRVKSALNASSVQALEPLQKRALEQLAEDLEERTPHGAWHVRICRAAETAELLSPTHPSSDRENAGVPRAPRATMAATTLRVTTLSGKQVTLQKTLDEPLQLLRREVSEALGVVKLSKDLRNAFTVICQPRRRLSRRQLYVIDRHVVKLHEKSILLGDVDFQCEGDNLLELLIWNCPVEDILWVMPLLLQGGCPVNVPSATGAVPLVTACKRGLGQVGQILLQQGADPFATWHGEDALDCALYYLYRCQCRRGLRRSHGGMCLFAPRGAMLSREKVLERSGVQNTFGDALWAGWPMAFFTFSDKISPHQMGWDDSFSSARALVLATREPIARSKHCQSDLIGEPLEYEGGVYSDFCSCRSCCPWLFDSDPEEMSDFLQRNTPKRTRKWQRRATGATGAAPALRGRL